MLTDLKTADLLDQLAAAAPVPGGGSAAALIGAAAAALVVMVARLTAAKKTMAHLRADMERIVAQGQTLQATLTAAVDRDADAYAGVLAALRLPRADDGEKAARQQALDKAMATAALVPLETARSAAALMDLAARVVADGLPSARSDALVALMAARTAVRAGVCNVRINLGSVADPAAAATLSKEADALELQAARREDEILERFSF